MVLTLAVGNDDCLFGHIDQMDEVPVDDEALSNPDERRLFIPKLFADGAFNLTELRGNLTAATVLCIDFGIVAVRRDKHQPVRGNPQKLSVCRYDEELGHSVAKIRFSIPKYKSFRGTFRSIV